MTTARMQSRFVDLDGPVHYADYGGEGGPIVLVHGLDGSHLNWMPVAPRLATLGRVVAVDLFGHGRTPSLRRTARVSANVRMLGRFLDALGGGPAVLMGNSMGGYVSLALAAAEPAKVRAIVLVNAALPLARALEVDRWFFLTFAGMALPVVGEALLHARWRRGPERMVRDLLALCCVDADRISRDVVDAHVALAAERTLAGPVARRDFLAAQRSLMNRLLRRRRFFEMVATIRAPTLILQGDRDRLVRVASARALAAARPDWRLEVLEGVGHVPQLETPERFLGVVEPWLRGRA
jgi:pimeloyl-ACP methyl ester carboxylesterase